MHRETGTGSGTETGSMGTGIGSATRDEMIGEETMAVVAASASVVGAVGGSSRNTDGTTIGAGSSNVITSADIVVGAKTARLFVCALISPWLLLMSTMCIPGVPCFYSKCSFFHWS